MKKAKKKQTPPAESPAEQLRLYNVHLSKMADELACVTEQALQSANRMGERIAALETRVAELCAQVQLNTARVLVPPVVPNPNGGASGASGRSNYTVNMGAAGHRTERCQHELTIDSNTGEPYTLSVRCELPAGHSTNHHGCGRFWQ